MTRKDYVKIAAALRAANPVLPENRDACPDSMEGYNAAVTTWRVMAAGVARELAADSPRFDAVRFFVACGVFESVAQYMADELEHL